MFVFKIAQFFNPLNEIEAIDNAWVDDKNWFPKVNQKYLWISISKVENQDMKSNMIWSISKNPVKPPHF